MMPKERNNILIETTMTHTNAGGPTPVAAVVCEYILENRRMIRPKTVIISNHPMPVAARETGRSVSAVRSEIYPQIIQHAVATAMRMSESVEFVPQVSAITTAIIVAVIAYSIHRTQFCPLSTFSF